MLVCRLRTVLLVRIAQMENRGRVTALLAGCLLTVCAGCSSTSTGKFVPTETRAREALEAALTAWQEGKTPDQIEGAPVQVRAVDSQWRVREEIDRIRDPGPGAGRGAAGVLGAADDQAGSSQPSVVRYYVVGNEPPLGVQRGEDYKTKAGDVGR